MRKLFKKPSARSPALALPFWLLLLLGLSASSLAPAAEPHKIVMLASPSSAGPFAAFSTINTRIEEFTDKLQIDVRETQGAHFHVRYMLRRPSAYQDTVFWTGTVVNWAARTGVEPFYPEPSPEAGDFRIIAVMGLTYNVWVSMDPSVRTPQDFVGKRVGIGLLSQNEWGMHQQMLLDAWSLTPELASLDVLGPGQNISALLDGRTHVGTLFGLLSADTGHAVVTGPHRQLEATTRPWHYVNVPKKMIEEYIEATGAPFRIVELPANTLPNQPEPITTFGNLLVMAAHKSFPEEPAYELVRMLAEHHETIAAYSAFTRAWTPATLAFTADTNPEAFHPGALRAFKDLGLLE